MVSKFVWCKSLCWDKIDHIDCCGWRWCRWRWGWLLNIVDWESLLLAALGLLWGNRDLVLMMLGWVLVFLVCMLMWDDGNGAGTPGRMFKALLMMTSQDLIGWQKLIFKFNDLPSTAGIDNLLTEFRKSNYFPAMKIEGLPLYKRSATSIMEMIETTHLQLAHEVKLNSNQVRSGPFYWNLYLAGLSSDSKLIKNCQFPSLGPIFFSTNFLWQGRSPIALEWRARSALKL